jgi:four helix bundle protein
VVRGDDISERLTAFAVRTIRFSKALGQGGPEQHIAGQVLRSGTGAGANYEEARGAESRADFVHKMGIVLKELKETRYWLKVAAGAKLVNGRRLLPLLNECEELCGVVGQSIMTARKNAQTSRASRTGTSE